MNNRVFCYGEIGVDNIVEVPHLPSPEIAAFPVSDTYHIGGAAANTAVWLASLGVDTALGGNWIGHDRYGRLLWEWLDGRPRLDLRYVRRSDAETTPFCRVLVTPDGERTFLVYGYPQTTKTELAEEHLQGAAYMALDLYGGAERMRAAELAHSAGVQTAVGDVVTADHPILPIAPLVLNSAAFMRESLPGVDVREQCRRLQAVNRGIVIATDGARAIFALNSDGEAFSVQPPPVTAVDATGAGDAFRAGLLAGLLKGEPFQSALCWGAAAGALSVRHQGAATVLPQAEEIIALAGTLKAEAVS